MQTISKTVYNFSELNDKAKETARSGYRTGLDFDAECTIEDARHVAKLMGWDIDEVYWSGFSSQGDGAQFTGYMRYAKGCAKAVKAFAPLDTELQRIAQAWQNLQRSHFYALRAEVTHRGHYMHEMCTSFDCVDTRDSAPYYFPADTEDAIKEIGRDFMRWIYKQLENEYEYQTSDEAVDEAIEVNSYIFDEDGNIN